MRRTQKLAVLIALVAAVFSAYWVVKRGQSPVHDQRSESPHQSVAQEAIAEAKGSTATINPGRKNSDSASDPLDEVADCISPAQLESDPVLAEEYARFDSLVTSGPTIESYRGLSSAMLAGLADQGDSAAMAVLGAVSLMRAMELPEDQAVAFLLLEQTAPRSAGIAKPIEPAKAKHLEEASDWFYRAALHGRLLALQNVGEIMAIVAGSPVELGWISPHEYDALEVFERHALDPANVYGALAFEIAPELRSGLMGTMISDLTPGGEQQQTLLHELARRFNKDREAANLPPIVISASTELSTEEIDAMLFCNP